MLGRALTLAAGLAGATSLSQYPKVATRYIQRLGGTVRALEVVVGNFDRSAASSGLTRAEAIEGMSGNAFLARRPGDIARTIARHDRLKSDLGVREGRGPVARLTVRHRYLDREIVADTAAAFRPALPLTLPGLLSAGAGSPIG